MIGIVIRDVPTIILEIIDTRVIIEDMITKIDIKREEGTRRRIAMIVTLLDYKESQMTLQKNHMKEMKRKEQVDLDLQNMQIQ